MISCLALRIAGLSRRVQLVADCAETISGQLFEACFPAPQTNLVLLMLQLFRIGL